MRVATLEAANTEIASLTATLGPKTTGTVFTPRILSPRISLISRTGFTPTTRRKSRVVRYITAGFSPCAA